jgi:hypothetical protein
MRSSEKDSHLFIKRWGQKFFIRGIGILQWILIPVIFLVAAENSLKNTVDTKPAWYLHADIIAKNHPVDFLFIGSSRVGAAIDSNAFDDYMSTRLGKNTLSINLGQGYSSIQEHYLGLRNLLNTCPESFRDFTVFLEAPGETPNLLYYSTWTDNWINSDQVQLVVPLLKPPDIIPFWLSGSGSPAIKTFITLKYYLNPFKLVRFKERIKEKIETKVKEMIQPPSPGQKTDLSESGGVKTKQVDIARVRTSAQRFAREQMDAQEPFLNWDETVLADLIKLIKSHNGKVVFFKMPVSSAQLNVFKTKIHRDNRITFKQQLKKWDTVILYPDFSYTDEDFPDLWHLRYSRCAEFSGKLAQAYTDILKMPSH